MCVAFLTDERKGASRVRAQRPEKAGPQKEHLVAGYGGDVADEAGAVTYFAEPPCLVKKFMVKNPLQGLGTMKGF